MKRTRNGLLTTMWLGLVVMLCIAGMFVTTLRRSVSHVSSPSRSENDQPVPSLQIPNASPASPAPPAEPFSPPIRVNLTAAPVSSLTVSVEGPYRIHPVGHSRILDQARRLKPVRVTLSAIGIRIGQRDFPVARLEIEPDDSPSIWVNDHQYRGRVRLIRRPNERLIAVNVLPMQQYVTGVVDSEMPAAFPTAARRAQAIVARTFALYQMMQAPDDAEFDLYATTRSQRYLGFQYRNGQGRRLAGESADSRRMARETAGIVCLWRGDLFCTYYSAVCGGRTTPGQRVFSDAAPPLQSVSCRWCRDAPRYRWTKTLAKSEVAAQLAGSNDDSSGELSGRPGTDPRGQVPPRNGHIRTRASIIRVSGAPYNRSSVYEVRHNGHRQRLSAVELRRRLSKAKLPSPRYIVRDLGESLQFRGRGHGHGVGLCQWGARGLALAGQNELQIIRYYYPGAEIVVLEPNNPDR